MHKLILIVLLFGLLSNYPSSLAAADSASYTYDALGRLTTVSGNLAYNFVDYN